MAVRKDPSRRQRGALLIELRVRNGLPSRSLGEDWWEVLVMLQSSLPTCLKTPVLQTGSRITSRIFLVAGVGVAPTEAEFMRLA